MNSMNSEITNIRYTAHQFWEQEGPNNIVLGILGRLS